MNLYSIIKLFQEIIDKFILINRLLLIVYGLMLMNLVVLYFII